MTASPAPFTSEHEDDDPLAPSPPPVALSIAGSDPSGGAGIQADLKTFSALGAYGTTAITALTAQNTRGVTGVHVVPPDFVAQQLATLAEDVRIDAIKIGMLATAQLAGVVGDFLSEQARSARPPYVVLDPVMVATSGDRLLDESAVAAVRELLPLADLVTPNVAEAAVLLDTEPARDLESLSAQAHALVAAGARRVLAKGGHGMPDATDVLADKTAEAGAIVTFVGRRVDTQNTHGTGCSLSSALAALRPQRDSWPATIRDAKDWLTGALAAADTLDIGSGHGPVHHFYDVWSL